MTYISVGRRAVAALIDGLVFLAVAIPIGLATGGYSNRVTAIGGRRVHSIGFSVTGVPFLLTLLIWLVYMTAMEGSAGASLGKLATGIRVRKLDGSPVDMTASAIRNGLRIVDGLFFYLVAAILVWSSPTRQRLGDRAAGTVVVPAGAVPAPRQAGFPPPSAGLPPPPPG